MKKILSVILSIFMMISVLPMSKMNVFATTGNTSEFAGGSGTEDDPYLISTSEHLYNVRYYLDANYEMINDIDLTEDTAKGGLYDNEGQGWLPIGTWENPFKGLFDGKGFEIIGLRIAPGDIEPEESHYFGLFSYVVNGKIKNLGMRNGVTEKAYGEVLKFGTITGYMLNSTIENCYNMGCINFQSLCSYAFPDRTIDESIIGGIVGKAYKSTISKCYNTGDIIADVQNPVNCDWSIVGGICGKADDTTIKDCYNTGNLHAVRWTNGGFGNSYGIVCAEDSSVTIENSYSIGTSVNPIANGSKNESIINCYHLSGCADNYGSTALNESQLTKKQFFQGFDFENVWTIDANAIYPYPQLRDNLQDIRERVELLSIVSFPEKSNYLTGDELDLTGGLVKVIYASEKEEIIPITKDMVSGYDSNIVGEQNVVVSVNDATTTFTVNVTKRPLVKSMMLISPPNKNTFVVGTSFDFTGAKVLTIDENNASETIDITADMTTGGNINIVGKQTITYTKDGINVTFEIEVLPLKLEGIEVTKLPDKTMYYEGEALDLTGLNVSYVMNDGTKYPIQSGYNVSGYSSTPGIYDLIVEYAGNITTFNVIVKPMPVVEIFINGDYQKEYWQGDNEFDKDGMIITAYMQDGTLRDVTDMAEITGFDSFNPGQITMKATYQGVEKTFVITIKEFKIDKLNVKVIENDYKSVTLSWDENARATSYEVYRKGYKEDAEFELIQTVETNSANVSGLMTGKIYSFYVIAKNGTIQSEASNIVQIATQLKGKPTLQITKVSSTKYNLSWTKIDGATRYIIYRKRNDDKMKKVLTLGASDLSYVTAELPHGSYEFIVKAGRYDSKDRVMTGASNSVSCKVEKTKPAITLTAGTKQVKVTWKKLEGVTHYEVYQATSKSGTYKKLKTTTSTSYTSKSLTTGKTYYYKVRGYKNYKSGDTLQYNVNTKYSDIKSIKVK